MKRVRKIVTFMITLSMVLTSNGGVAYGLNIPQPIVKIADQNLKEELLKKCDENKDNEIDEEEIMHLDSLELSDSKIKSLDGIQNAVNMQSLNISFDNDEELDIDLSVLSKNTQLTSLSITGKNKINIVNLDSISNCSLLSLLNLTNCNISNLCMSSNLVSLNELTLNNCNLTDITPLSNLKSINTLNLANNRIEDVSALTNINSINKLDLSNNPIQNIKQIENINYINELNISNCGNNISKQDILSLFKIDITQLVEGQNREINISPDIIYFDKDSRVSKDDINLEVKNSDLAIINDNKSESNKYIINAKNSGETSLLVKFKNELTIERIISIEPINSDRELETKDRKNTILYEEYYESKALTDDGKLYNLCNGQAILLKENITEYINGCKATKFNQMPLYRIARDKDNIIWELNENEMSKLYEVNEEYGNIIKFNDQYLLTDKYILIDYRNNKIINKNIRQIMDVDNYNVEPLVASDNLDENDNGIIDMIAITNEGSLDLITSQDQEVVLDTAIKKNSNSYYREGNYIYFYYIKDNNCLYKLKNNIYDVNDKTITKIADNVDEIIFDYYVYKDGITYVLTDDMYKLCNEKIVDVIEYDTNEKPEGLDSNGILWLVSKEPDEQGYYGGFMKLCVERLIQYGYISTVGDVYTSSYQIKNDELNIKIDSENKLKFYDANILSNVICFSNDRDGRVFAAREDGSVWNVDATKATEIIKSDGTILQNSNVILDVASTSNTTGDSSNIVTLGVMLLTSLIIMKKKSIN